MTSELSKVMDNKFDTKKRYIHTHEKQMEEAHALS